MYRESKELSVLAIVGKWHELAEAIRAGCKLRPVQCFDQFHDSEQSACALGAAAEILDMAGWDIPQPTMDDGRCPIGCSHEIRRRDNLIPHLNDDHRWSREDIADFLDSL